MTGKPGNQPWLMVLIRSGHDDDVSNTGTVACAGLNFTQLDAKTANLDLKVVAAEIVNGAIGVPAPQITCLIQACAGCRGKRVGNETFGTQFWPVQVAARNLYPANMEFTHHPDRNRASLRVENIHTNIGFGPTDGDQHAVGIIGAGPAGDVHGGFRRPIQVVQFSVGQISTRLPDGGGRQGFPATEYRSQTGALAGFQHAEKVAQHRRDKVSDGHPCLFNQCAQVIRVFMTLRLSQQQGCTDP